MRFTILSLAVALSMGATAQSIKKVETYYDPLTRSRVHEAYTTLSTPPYLNHGLYKEFDQSGILMNEINFQNGKKHGAFKVYINAGMADIYGRQNVGKVYTVTNYSNDQLNGLDQMFDYTKGKQQLILQKTWAYGNQIKEESWYEDGKPQLISTPNGLNTTWYSNGKKKQELTKRNGLEEGKVNEWFENGNLFFTGNFKEGHPIGEALVYFEDGTVNKVVTYDPVTYKNSHTIENFTTGKIKSDRKATSGNRYVITTYDSLKGFKRQIQEWMDDPNSNEGAIYPDGKNTEYDDDGSVVSVEEYKDGNGIGKVETLDKSGKIVLQGEFRNGIKSGEWLYYLNENGTKTNKTDKAFKYRKINYREGQLPFKYTDYYISGEKMAEGFLDQEWPDRNRNFIKIYHKNGKVLEEGPFGYNQMRDAYEGKTGEWKTYHENGAVKSKGRYMLGEQVGVWDYYDQNGNLTEQKRFN